jgi:hypothetical protein
MSRHASAWRLFVLPVTLHHSLKSPLFSFVSITLPDSFAIRFFLEHGA